VLLTSIMVVFVVGNVLCAISVSYWTLLGARLVLAACHGLVFGVAMVIASQLAPPHRQATAISLVIAGVSTATIIGVPLGTAIGNAYGWRTPFWVAAAIGVIACLILAWLIPNTGRQAGQKADTRAEIRAAIRPVAIFGFLLVAAFIMLSYIVPFLTDVGGVAIEVVPWVLLALGIASFVGNLLGGWLGDRNPVITTVGAFTLLIAIFALLSQLGSNPWIATGLLSLAWLTIFSVPASLQARLMREVKDAPNFASTLMNTATQVGIAAGAALGGFVLAAGWRYEQLPALSAAFAALALVATATLVLYDRRRLAVAA
jgi:DHA1 family inner membrane transport protein